MQKNEKRVKTRDDSTKNATLHKNISNRTTTVGDRRSLFIPIIDQCIPLLLQGRYKYKADPVPGDE